MQQLWSSIDSLEVDREVAGYIEISEDYKRGKFIEPVDLTKL